MTFSQNILQVSIVVLPFYDLLWPPKYSKFYIYLSKYLNTWLTIIFQWCSKDKRQLHMNLNARNDKKVTKSGDSSFVSYGGTCSLHSDRSFTLLKVNFGHDKCFSLAVIGTQCTRKTVRTQILLHVLSERRSLHRPCWPC